MRPHLLTLAICSMPLAAQWSGADTAWEVASEVLVATEWRQMQYVTENGYSCVTHVDVLTPSTTVTYYRKGMRVGGVDEKILGPHPLMKNVNMYFLAWEVAHPVISYSLHTPYRRGWQVCTVAFEAVVIPSNIRFGCRIFF